MDFAGLSFPKFRKKEDRKLAKKVRQLTGLPPKKLAPYRLAFRHASSVAQEGSRSERKALSYERLEFLGDAVLGAIVAHMLFQRYPYKPEGFLTETRSKLVNRESLNQLGQKLGLGELVEYEGGKQTRRSHRSLHGDVLEALIGAVYIDRGYQDCRRFVLSRLISPNFDLEKVVNSERNFKSRLIEWGQKQGNEVQFRIENEHGASHSKTFVAVVEIDGIEQARGEGRSKKKAEQSAAEKACNQLNITD